MDFLDEKKEGSYYIISGLTCLVKRYKITVMYSPG